MSAVRADWGNRTTASESIRNDAAKVGALLAEHLDGFGIGGQVTVTNKSGRSPITIELTLAEARDLLGRLR